MFYTKEKVWNELHSWAKLAYDKDKNEISGLLIAIPVKNGFELIYPDILKQENTATNTELDGYAIQDWSVKMKKIMDKEYPGVKFRTVWWHSHHMMGANWSGTDDKEIEAWKNKDYTISLLINLKGEHKLRVSYWHPVEYHVDTEVEVIREHDKADESMIKRYEELCSNKTHQYTYSANNHLNGWGNKYLKRQQLLFTPNIDEAVSAEAHMFK